MNIFAKEVLRQGGVAKTDEATESLPLLTDTVSWTGAGARMAATTNGAGRPPASCFGVLWHLVY